MKQSAEKNLPVRGTPAGAGRIVSEDEYRKEQAYLALVMNNFFSDYLLRLYREFDGDFIQVIVLANIAHHNVQRFVQQTDYDAGTARKIMESSGQAPDWMLPCNTFSISEALHIPRETVRRKVAALVRKGWLRRNERKELFVTKLPGEAFFQFNVDMINELLATADRLRSRLAGVAQGKSVLP